ncbi:MAG: carboxypeptidase regulatory-like domain-containing protein [Candidatus Hydrogenedentes bacterium]|nr:carboxypeptidase regulatory-like domain-containing protein [Candidatus Hydrogenedentota bacterium]
MKSAWGWSSRIIVCIVLLLSLSAQAVPVAGDVNSTGQVDAVDVQLVINGALGLAVVPLGDIDYGGIIDAVDVQMVINAALAMDIDADDDGLADVAEARLGTLINGQDSDGDGIPDGQEMLDGTNPLVPPEIPPIGNDHPSCVSGYVKDRTGSPLADVLVLSSLGDLAPTDARGYFCMPTAENVDLALYATGLAEIEPVVVHTPSSGDCTLGDCASVELSVSGSCLSGYVRNEHNDPVAGTPVRVTFTQWGIAQGVTEDATTTDDTGRFCVRGPANAEATISVEGAQPIRVLTNSGTSCEAGDCVQVAVQRPSVPPPTGSIAGWVQDTDGNAVLGAEVRTNLGNVVSTGADGFYELQGVPAGPVVVNFVAADYTSDSRAVDVLPDAETTVNSVLKRLSQPVTFDATQGGEVADGSGNRIQFAPSSIVNAQKKSVTGEVQVQITALDVTNEADFAAFPGEFVGISSAKNGEPVQLESFALADFRVTQNGEPLNLADGTTAEVELALPPGTPLETGQSVPLWYFDETLGLWVESGSGTVATASNGTGLAYFAEVPHLSWWNCDAPISDKHCLSGYVKDTNGTPIARARVEAVGLDYYGESSPARTDASGYFCIDVKRGSQVRLDVYLPGWPVVMASRIVWVPNVTARCSSGGCTIVQDFIVYLSCVSGYVKDHLGNPLADIPVLTSLGDWTLTNQFGYFCLETPGNMGLTLYTTGWPAWEPVTVHTNPSGDCELGNCATVELITLDSCVSGYVRDEQGNAVAGIQVQVVFKKWEYELDHTGIQQESAPTDEAGYFCVRVPGDNDATVFTNSAPAITVHTNPGGSCVAGDCVQVALQQQTPKNGDSVGVIHVDAWQNEGWYPEGTVQCVASFALGPTTSLLAWLEFLHATSYFPFSLAGSGEQLEPDAYAQFDSERTLHKWAFGIDTPSRTSDPDWRTDLLAFVAAQKSFVSLDPGGPGTLEVGRRTGPVERLQRSGSNNWFYYYAWPSPVYALAQNTFFNSYTQDDEYWRHLDLPLPPATVSWPGGYDLGSFQSTVDIPRNVRLTSWPGPNRPYDGQLTLTNPIDVTRRFTLTWETVSESEVSVLIIFHEWWRHSNSVPNDPDKWFVCRARDDGEFTIPEEIMRQFPGVPPVPETGEVYHNQMLSLQRIISKTADVPLVQSGGTGLVRVFSTSGPTEGFYYQKRP